MKKRLLSCLLVMVMVLSIAACGKTDEGTKESETPVAAGEAATDVAKMPVVKCAFPSFADVSDSEKVEAAINEILAPKYGIQCDITFIGVGSWSQQANLLLTGDEVDIITLWPLPLSTFVNSGNLLPLDDYLANASDAFRNKFTEEQWNGTKMGGIQYAVPNLRNYGNIFVVYFDENKLAELGYKAADIKTLDQVEEVVYAAHEKYPDVYTVVPQSQATFCNGWTWDGLGDQNYIGVLENCGQDTEVMDIFESKEFIDFCTRMHRWYNDGLMMGDALSNQDTGSNMIQNGVAFASFSNRACEPEPAGLIQSVIVDAWSDSTNITALTYGINSLSTVPDAAFKLLEALYCDTDVQMLLINGIENVHYVKNGDGTISYPDGVDASTSTYGEQSMYWSLPYANSDVLPIVDLGSASFFSDLIDFNNSCKPSIATGIVIDTEALGIVDEYAACLNVKDKYYDGLMNGVLDPVTVMEQAHNEMVDAGIEKICAAKQGVLDEFLGK